MKRKLICLIMLSSLIVFLLQGCVSSENIINQNSDQKYSLSTLQQFLPNDKNALQDFLDLFIQSTNSNLYDLENAVFDNNFFEIKAIAHKMNPVFKQIQAQEITIIIDDLENKDLSIAEIDLKVINLKNKIEDLFQEMKKA